MSSGIELVADHTFFEEVGQRSIEKTVLQMLWHVKEANAMLQSEESILIKKRAIACITRFFPP